MGQHDEIPDFIGGVGARRLQPSAGESAGQRRREFGEHHRSAQRRDPDAGAAVDAIGAAAAGDPGEKHDNPYHHQIEQWLVQQLPLRRPQGSVLMEMINPSQQAQVDKVKQWLQSDPTVRDGRVAELIARQPGWKWELYGGVTMAAMRAPYPLWSANTDRSEITAFYQQPQFPAGSYRRSRRCARRWKRPSALRTAARLRPTSCRRCWRSSSSATGAWRNVCWRRRRPRC